MNDLDRSPEEREALVEAMAECCAKHGYTLTDEAEIAAEAGLPTAALRRHFADKEECGLAAVESVLAAGVAAVGEAYAADRSEWESVFFALRTLLDIFVSRPPFARLAFIDSRQSMPESSRARYESGFAIVTAMLDRLRGEGASGPTPACAARAAIGGGEALIRRRLAEDRAAELPATLPALVYTATVPFLGQSEALRLMRQAQRFDSDEPGP